MGFAGTNCFWVCQRRAIEGDRKTDIEKEENEIIPVQEWVLAEEGKVIKNIKIYMTVLIRGQCICSVHEVNII